jgi:hypothetical protein
VTYSFDDHSGCVISLHGEEGGGGLEALPVSLNKVLDGGIRTVDEEAIDKGGAVDRPIGGSDEVLRVPAVCTRERDADVMERQLGSEQADILERLGMNIASNPGVYSMRFSVRLAGLPVGRGISTGTASPYFLRSSAFIAGFAGESQFPPSLKGFDGDDFSPSTIHLLGEEPGKFPPIDGVRVDDAESSVPLFLCRVGRNAFGLQCVGERCAEQVIAQSADIGEGCRRCNQAALWSSVPFQP